MTARLEARRGFDLPALAGPKGAVADWAERPGEHLEGVTTAVDSSNSLTLATDLLKSLQGLAGTAAGEGALKDGLTAIADAVTAKDAPAEVPLAANRPALKGGWSLMQQMNIREASLSLRKEYTFRRQILLRRLDVTVQSMMAGEKAKPAAGQRKSAEVLSRMWAGWRRGASEAPPLSEWSALAVSRSVLARAVTARVSGPNNRMKSFVKTVKIGAVPDRGGKVDHSGSAKKDPVKRGGEGGVKASSTTAASSEAAPKARAERKRKEGGAIKEAASSGAAGGAAAPPPSAADANAAPVSAAPKKEEKKGSVEGARSTNLDMMNETKKQKKEEYEQGGPKQTYWDELNAARGGGGAASGEGK